ncbi:MAG: NUDIX domain-containing protein [bacterium]
MAPERVYEQAAVAAWREGEGGAEVLLISARGGDAPGGGRRWVLPQGGVEPGETPVQAAASEAWEEAGVEGEVEPRPFAGFEYEIGAGRCRVSAFRMRVAWEAPDWPERDERERRWLPWREAAAAVSGETLRGVLERFRPPGEGEAKPKGMEGEEAG